MSNTATIIHTDEIVEFHTDFGVSPERVESYTVKFEDVTDVVGFSLTEDGCETLYGTPKVSVRVNHTEGTSTIWTGVASVYVETVIPEDVARAIVRAVHDLDWRDQQGDWQHPVRVAAELAVLAWDHIGDIPTESSTGLPAIWSTGEAEYVVADWLTQCAEVEAAIDHWETYDRY